MTGKKLKIVVGGTLARVPDQGGIAWVVLQYVLGLQQLGHEVHFVESLPAESIVPSGASLAESLNAAYFRKVADRFGLASAATLVDADSGDTVGLDLPALHRRIRQSALLLNLSGCLPMDETLHAVPCRAYLDLDPGFTQLWQVVQGLDLGMAGHTHHVTVGLSIGQPDCPVPTGGTDWIRTVQPVVLREWPVADRLTHDAFTTVANWRGYGSVEYRGRFFGQKAHSLRPLLGLPAKAGETFRLALAIHPDETSDIEGLRRGGWERVDPVVAAGTPDAFRAFVRGSRAEFGIAKSGYVESRCGWFSDRSICYLASGRPVIAQDTGFARHLPVGRGLFSFAGVEDVLESIEALRRDYGRHRGFARRLAEEHFDSDVVLGRLLRTLGVC